MEKYVWKGHYYPTHMTPEQILTDKYNELARSTNNFNQNGNINLISSGFNLVELFVSPESGEVVSLLYVLTSKLESTFPGKTAIREGRLYFNL